MLKDAIDLATRAHSDQVDKQGNPYIWHCIAIMNRFDDELDRTVAVLHDVIEDTWVTYFDLAKMFPLEVVHAVEYLTRRKVYGETYRDYIRRLADHSTARRVKISDLYHNLSRISELSSREKSRLEVRYTWALEYLLDREKQNV